MSDFSSNKSYNECSNFIKQQDKLRDDNIDKQRREFLELWKTKSSDISFSLPNVRNNVTTKHGYLSYDDALKNGFTCFIDNRGNLFPATHVIYCNNGQYETYNEDFDEENKNLVKQISFDKAFSRLSQ